MSHHTPPITHNLSNITFLLCHQGLFNVSSRGRHILAGLARKIRLQTPRDVRHLQWFRLLFKTLADSGGGRRGRAPPILKFQRGSSRRAKEGARPLRPPFEIPKRVFKRDRRCTPPPFHKSWIRPCKSYNNRLNRSIQGCGSRGGGQGGNCPQLFVSMGCMHTCAPPLNLAITIIGISTFLPPPQEKNRSRAPGYI